MKAKEKRNSRSYKTTDKVYKKAMKRAKKEKTILSNLIEEFVTNYSCGSLPIQISKTVPLPSDYVNWQKIGYLNSDGTITDMLDEPLITPTIKSKKKI